MSSPRKWFRIDYPTLNQGHYEFAEDMWHAELLARSHGLMVEYTCREISEEEVPEFYLLRQEKADLANTVAAMTSKASQNPRFREDELRKSIETFRKEIQRLQAYLP